MSTTPLREQRELGSLHKIPQPSCPACGGVSSHHVRRPFKSALRIWKCRTCGFVYCFPLPLTDSQSAGSNSVLTNENYTAGLLKHCESTQNQYDKLAERRYRRYSDSLHKRRFRLLEIGCGSCGLASRLSQLGVDYVGIDLDSRVIERARSLGIRDVRRLDFFEMPEDERFDVITFSQVLEHIMTPVPFLKKIHTMLQPSGVVHCDVPNHYSLSSIVHRLPISRVRWGAIKYPYHLFAYSSSSLEALLAQWFLVKVFDANVNDPVWGQGSARDSSLARIGPLLRLLRARSLLVAYGTRREISSIVG